MNISSRFFNYFKTGSDKPMLENNEEITRLFERKRTSVFLSLLFGYSFFYGDRSQGKFNRQAFLDRNLHVVRYA